MFRSQIAPAPSTSRTRALLAAFVAACALLAAGHVAPADAAVTCQFSAGGALTIQGNAVHDAPKIVRSGDNILVGKDWYGPGVTCSGGQATVHNTHVIAYSDGSGDATSFLIDLRGGRFTPGQVNEPGDTDEIDIQANLGSGLDDRLYIWGSDGGESMRLGQTANGAGVNLNAGAESVPGATPDVDVDLRGAEMGILYAGTGNDRYLASGGPEFSGPFPVRIDANGEAGDDEIVGGDGPDNITDGPGNDVVRGGANDDGIVEWGQAGDDTFDGGPGSDRMAWAQFTDPIRVDLRITARQDTGAAGRDSVADFENVSTSEGNDVLIGTDGPNVLSTGDGDDLILGLGGTDKMQGGQGQDTASYAIPPAGVTQGVNVSLFKQGVVQDTGGAGIDQLEGIQNLTGSPYADTLTGNDGDNKFEVRDGQGDTVVCNNGVDSVVADAEGTDDVNDDCDQIDFDVRPDTRIDAGPSGLIRDRTPSFRFSATKDGSSFECSIDGGPFIACAGAQTLGRLPNGAHVLRVRAKDLLGAVDLSPAERTFSVDGSRPRISRVRILAGGRIQLRLSEAATLKVVIRGSGRVRKLTRKGITGLNRIPAKIARGSHRITITATDAAGNRSRRVLEQP
jgi:Ca2+-binding RTX toxin-like protein